MTTKPTKEEVKDCPPEPIPDPVPVPTPAPEPEPILRYEAISIMPHITQSDLQRKKNLTLAAINAILAQYNGKESDIPINHEYWTLVNYYRVRLTQIVPEG